MRWLCFAMMFALPVGAAEPEIPSGVDGLILDIAPLEVVVAESKHLAPGGQLDGGQARDWLEKTTATLINDARLPSPARNTMTLRVRATVTFGERCAGAYPCDPVPGVANSCGDNACFAWERTQAVSGWWELGDRRATFRTDTEYAEALNRALIRRAHEGPFVQALSKLDPLVPMRLAALDREAPSWPSRPEARALIKPLLEAMLRGEGQAQNVLARLRGWEKSPEAKAMEPALTRAVLLDFDHRSVAQLHLALINPRWLTSPLAREVVPDLIAALDGNQTDALLGAALLKDPRVDVPLCRFVTRAFSAPAPLEPMTLQRLVNSLGATRNPCVQDTLYAVATQRTSDASTRQSSLRDLLRQRPDLAQAARGSREPWALFARALEGDAEAVSQLPPEVAAQLLVDGHPPAVKAAAARAALGAPPEELVTRLLAAGADAGALQDGAYRKALLELAVHQRAAAFLAGLVQLGPAEVRAECVEPLRLLANDAAAAGALLYLAQAPATAAQAKLALQDVFSDFLRAVLSEAEPQPSRLLVALEELARRKDLASRPLVKKLVNHRDPAVRKAARAYPGK